MGRHPPKKPQNVEVSTKDKLKQIKKERKLKLKEKRARLVIRNLPFEATEENLKEHFAQFGEVQEVKVLKKEDGKLVGCGFVQFKLVQKAAKARHHLNGKPFLGREIEVDFALAKNKYKTEDKKEIKEEDEVKVKEEPVDVDESQEVAEEVKSEDEAEGIGSDSEQKKTDSEDNEGVSDEEEEEQEPPVKKPKFESNDVTEGKTIFIKNVPFTATNDDIKQCMSQFGPLYYALICVDKYTEHSKGTAFVKFRNAEDAQKALEAGTELTLLGNVLDCHRALGRDEVRKKAETKKEEKTAPKDSRNLYLVKEGVILAGGKAAEGVSASDMAKRLQLEQYKTQMLRNLNMFVSRERLVIHNLPPSWDDKKLHILVKNNSPKNSVIREARIMRDLKNVDADGVGRSKEFGFVTFNRHEDALATLRALNNNPNIFSAHKRPIVAFSIENRAMIKAKQKRLEKSRLKNPKCKEFNPKVVKEDQERKQKRLNETHDTEGEFVGVTAKPGKQKMRSRYNLKTQARLHLENLKKEKKKAKFSKKTLKERKQDFTKQPKQKINKKKENDNFSKLVADYKKKLLALPVQKKTKWYE
ncbi:RNA-binding protein 28 [Tribolium castaneum]|uniref:RNA-binding protein 28-like Protein n=1 Tax=Tribolium castaneum TaxID=7070 RepID=D1ZZP3_TRICA|nr:PREDICTED: RNA-binding protein 28 [Tribolium castaneum]EFA01819.1 RNA-binding protein 28-like Protein [Tribolium castaneum]|eukprot:XP_974350.1 PREDICTED: RNA-binding protein 28 [Tribolium castaneum]